MKTLLLSSLVKVFKDTEPNFNEFSSFSCLKNESFSFQLGLLAETADEALVTFEIDSDIKKILCKIKLVGIAQNTHYIWCFCRNFYYIVKALLHLLLFLLIII